MSEFTNNLKKRSEKLNQLVEELDTIDNFRDDMRSNKSGLEIYSASDYCLKTKKYEHLDMNVKGLIEVAFKNRYEEIQQILNDEFGGAWKTIEREENKWDF